MSLHDSLPEPDRPWPAWVISSRRRSTAADTRRLRRALACVRRSEVDRAVADQQLVAVVGENCEVAR